MDAAPPRDHRVGKLWFEIETTSLAHALRWRARAEELAWQRIPALLGEVLDAAAPPGLALRIDRLELDLGTMAADALEQALPAAFERALRAAIEQAAGSGQARAPGAALLDEFGGYLVHGTVPARGAARRFAPAAILARLIEEQPEALLDLLRRHAGQRQVVQRLVLQAGESGLRALLALLAPHDRALVLAYLDDFGQLHPQPPEAPLRRALWRLTLQYLLHEAGSQFNRRRYLASLIEGVARDAGIGYAQLLALMHAAAAQVRASRPLSGSLPGVLDELLHERAASAQPPPAPAAAAAVASAAAGQLDPLLERLRGALAQPVALEMLTHELPAPVFAAVIARLQPDHAPAILAYLDDMMVMHRRAPQLNLNESEFETQLRLLTLRYLLLNAGTRFNRLSWLRRLLHGLAERAGVAYASLLAAFSGALERLRARLPMSGSLPEALATLTAELGQHPGPHPAAPPGDVVGAAEHFLRSGAPREAGRHLCMLAAADPAGFAALLRRLHRAAPGKPQALIDRLLDWMLPEEIVAALLPAQAGQAAQLAEWGAERPGASIASSWTQVLTAALRGDTLQVPEPGAWPARRLDRDALLRHWLDHGTLPPWADCDPATLLAELERQTPVALHAVFGDDDADRVAARLRRACARIGARAARQLLERLAPSTRAGGPLATLEQGLGEAARQDLRIRAAAAAVTGAGLDLEQLGRAVPAPPMSPPDMAAHGAEPDLRLLFAWLTAAPGGAPAPDDRARRLLADLLERGDDSLERILREGLARPEARQRWADSLPDDILARLVRRLAPRQAGFMLGLQAVVLPAWRQSAPSAKRRGARGQIWSLLLEALAGPTPPAPRAVAGRLIAALADAAPQETGRLLGRARELAREGGYVNVSAALQPSASVVRPLDEPGTPAPAPARPPAPHAALTDGATLYIGNAGLVLCHPFLGHFFRQLGLLKTDADGIARITGTEDASRAVHLLQYLVDERCDAPEPELALNKLLCGIPLETPVLPSITPSADELAMCDGMLQAVIGNWPIIRNTSPAGLRETFLRRDGRLLLRDSTWGLTVSRKTVDVLVDQVPWGLAIILHAWMPNELSVTW